MKELGGFIALCFLGMLWIEKTSRVFSVEGDVKIPISQNELAPVIGEEIYLVADSVFQKAEGIALQKTKEEIARFNASIKYKLDILNGLEAFKGKSLEEMAARAMLGPLTDSDNADTWIKFQKAITTIYQEKTTLIKPILYLVNFCLVKYHIHKKIKPTLKVNLNLMCQRKAPGTLPARILIQKPCSTDQKSRQIPFFGFLKFLSTASDLQRCLENTECLSSQSTKNILTLAIPIYLSLKSKYSTLLKSV